MTGTVLRNTWLSNMLLSSGLTWKYLYAYVKCVMSINMKGTEDNASKKNKTLQAQK